MTNCKRCGSIYGSFTELAQHLPQKRCKHLNMIYHNFDFIQQPFKNGGMGSKFAEMCSFFGVQIKSSVCELKEKLYFVSILYYCATLKWCNVLLENCLHYCSLDH
jgi:hypothetical protein